MWQALLAAAVAGSTGLVAKHLFKPNLDSSAGVVPSDPLQAEELDAEDVDRQDHVDVPMTELLIASITESPVVTNTASDSECDAFFRFSSSGARGGKGCRFGFKNLKKKAKVRCYGLAKEDRVKKDGEGFSGLEFSSEHKKNRRRFSVCSKRRKTNNNITGGKCGSCSSRDDSLFSWGLGVGMMYFMTAGKAEINKLNTTMDETVKMVQELKTELHKRKSAHNLQLSGMTMAPEIFSYQSMQPEFDNTGTENKSPTEIKIPSIPIFEDGDYESSVLTEEMEPGMREMYHLEAELESELEKLPWCTSEASYQGVLMPNLGEVEDSENDFHGHEIQTSHVLPSQGVVPAELDKKLCHVLINQQENQIVELESELQSAQSKLKEKETELEALKDCVRRLTEISLSACSDDEAGAEAGVELEQTGNWNHSSEQKKSGVGMKRVMISCPDACNYYIR